MAPRYVGLQALLLLLIVVAVVDWSQASKNQIMETSILLDQVQSLLPLPVSRDLNWYGYVHHHQKRGNSDEEDNSLRTSLIIVFTIGITIGLLFIMTICAFCMLHRARYGKFCCLKAKIRYPRQALNFESDCSEEETDLTGPPQYDATYLVNESPPVYEDALQDIVIATGINTSEIQLPPYPLSQPDNSISSETQLQETENEESRQEVE